ncbi:MAG: DUF424 family protein [Euryarchaeota archaeon]|nr:DUF424 family protein [Euryarchaeota archaeon]
MQCYVKTYRTEGEVVLAACDMDLCGKKFAEGDLYLEVSEGFYKGEICGEDELEELLKEATISNLVGEGAVGCGIRAGVIDSENVITGIPHAQMVMLL